MSNYKMSKFEQQIKEEEKKNQKVEQVHFFIQIFTNITCAESIPPFCIFSFLIFSLHGYIEEDESSSAA